MNDDETRLLLSVASAGYRMALNNTPFCSRMYEVMRNPKPGDLVLELSGRARMDVCGLGYLVKDVDPDSSDGGVLRLLDGTEQRWDNATFVRVPTDELVRAVDDELRADGSCNDQPGLFGE